MDGQRQLSLSRPIGRRRFLRALALGGGAALLAACQAPAPRPPGAAPPPSAAAPGEPAATWEQRWTALIEAARREGKVVFSGPPTPEVRTQVSAVFKERFGVEVEYLGGRRGDLLTRLRSERAVGLYTVDVIVGGAQSIAVEFYPEGLLDPLRPALIHPEVTNPTKWKPGKLWFIDPEEQYALRLLNSVSPILGINTSKVDPREIRSAWDLLNPKYRGLIAQDDPTVAGSGANTAAYLHLRLGEEFLRRLYVDQQVRFTRDRRQLSDWLGRGVYPIVINPNAADVLEPLLRDGFPIEVIQSLPDLPAHVTAGSGIMVLLNNAPHPNAAKLLVNWLASREGLAIYSRAEQGLPLRVDVDASWAREYLIPKPGVEYFDSFEWTFTISDKAPLSQKIKAWLGS
jgi:iron(III) transport system substrate-binding protein